ncbi:Chromosome-associated kinesin KIF4 [Dissostichus eleginoides]|uniref:Chromosome-associated kinesin KIF4 n=1 Tax=Dissostichus eleginoides TaxID=100907 RepID=A0AAD9BKZ6_DISEL|nr:Chromosome-associated kinesin KIF4 [Dissostichus eleginoides]
MIHWTPRAEFLDNTNNKSELIHLRSSTFRKHNITVEQCDNDADTSIVREALATATDDSVEVRAEDADVLVMLVHHIPSTNHPLFFTTSKGSYDVRRIREALSERERCYLLFCHAFTGCDTVSAIAGHGKTTLFDRFCAGDIDEHVDIFLDTQATKDAVIQAGTTIFQYIYHAPGIHGYEPVPTLDPMAPEELLQFTSCNCNGDCSNSNGDCSNRRCSCKRNGVKCISACGVCKGISCKNCGHDGGESGEDSEIDS